MSPKARWLGPALLAIVVAGCGPRGQTAGGGEVIPSGPQAFSGNAASPASVDLVWAASPGATGYQIEAKYGNGDYFDVAQASADQDSFTHFVVPGTGRLTYRLTWIEGGVAQEAGTVTVQLPEAAPDPVVLTEVMPYAPIVGPMPIDFSQIPTLDPSKPPDPSAMATMSALLSGIDPANPESLLPEVRPVSVSREIGPEGGTLELTDPKGASFVLEVPPDSVDEETLYTLEPIETIDGLPFDRLLGSVDIQPPLPFAGPAALTITLPAGSVSGDEFVVAFAISSLNHELSLTPVYRDGDSYVVDAYWGDTIGLAAGSRGQLQTQAARIPTDPAERISQTIALLQATSGESGSEAFAPIIRQVLAALVSPAESPASFRIGIAGHRASPRRQSQSGGALWSQVAQADRAWSTGGAHDANLAIELGRPGGAGVLVGRLASEIKQFLDTHTGCRTRDELYAEAFLQLLQRPHSPFQERLAAEFTSSFGQPGSLHTCLFELQIPQSRVVQLVQTGEGAGATYTARVHAAPFRLGVSGRGDHIHLYGRGPIAYDELSFLVLDCPPQIKLRLPSSAVVVVTDLKPIFDADLKVVDFQLRGIKGSVPYRGPNLGSVRSERGPDTCKVTGVTQKDEAPDLWSYYMSALHNPSTAADHWTIAGENSYVATNTVAGYGSGSFSEDTVMVLTVTAQDQP